MAFVRVGVPAADAQPAERTRDGALGLFCAWAQGEAALTEANPAPS